MSESFGAFVRALRKSCHLTLRQVEARVHVSSGYLSQIEQGVRGVPNVKILAKLAEAYNVPVTRLLHVAANAAAAPAMQAERPTRSDHILALLAEDERQPSPQTALPAPLCKGYARLTSENKQRLIDYLDFLLYKQEHGGPGVTTPLRATLPRI